jgi:hypothetical protein
MTNGEDAKVRVTRLLLTCGAAAGPSFLLTFVIQILARPGFHFTRSEASLLSSGRWGWIQIANFVIGGLLTIAGALGIRQALCARKGRLWRLCYLESLTPGRNSYRQPAINPLEELYEFWSR